ncbi:M20 family metallo-hydrolase [uncultured Aliiroseovarius sp.]|uniref:M20 family metallo-hydrolase n=1 Tax=uncultured Aliiroseovarius sp. TaxID=1658783 RepID=UPI002596496E|nr:M20 family metallo-hydrolase [uncultured Aliiroseovarius sp.]
MTDGELAQARLHEIAEASLEGPGVTRLPWTREHRDANRLIGIWMKDAGLDVSLDAAGTLVGRSPNAGSKPLILLGSHQDSVRQGGRYDGIMGIALACLVARRFRDRWSDLPVAISVLAFADEEGVRFPTALIGPRALAGTLDPSVFELADADGIRMSDAMRDFGLESERASALAMRTPPVKAYLECHIEQGPILEDNALPVGVVTGICGITRIAVTFAGETGHAGTVPMSGRRDALVGAAQFVDEVNRTVSNLSDLRATVGQFDVRPNVVNAIPNEVRLTLEIRGTDDVNRASFKQEMHQVASRIANTADLNLIWTPTYDQPAIACDAALRRALAAGVRQTGHRVLELPSGATHDSSAMADLCPVGMLFVRCRNGVSHRPDEFASADDMAVAIDVCETAIRGIADQTE